MIKNFEKFCNLFVYGCQVPEKSGNKCGLLMQLFVLIQIKINVKGMSSEIIFNLFK